MQCLATQPETPSNLIMLFDIFPGSLVEQHYKAEFGRFLKHQYSVERVSGASQLKISFPQIIEQNDIIVCTAQILENSLAKAKNGDEDGIKLSRRSHFPSLLTSFHHSQRVRVQSNGFGFC